jgi:hypothetical protein
MAFQIFNDGAVIRIENGTKILLVSKEQVKTIDTIQNNVVRIDIGEGPLKNIFINYQDVTNPAVGSANELRDLIKQWMLGDNYNGGDATEAGQVNILNKLGDIALILDAIKQKEADLTQLEPSRIDEANPYMVYRGWHKAFGDEQANEWAIQRITRKDDQIIYEWAFGTQRQIYKWWDRANFAYAPYDHNLPVEGALPLPPAPPVDPGGETVNPN